MKKLLVILGMLVGSLAQAQQLNVVVSMPAGSGVDTQARLIMKRYDELHGTQTVIQNRPGAEGAIGIQAMFENSANTILFPSAGHVIGAKEVDYRRIVPLVEISKQPFVLIGRKNLPVNNWDEFVAFSKKQQLNVGIGARAGAIPFVLSINERNGIQQNFIYYSAGGARGELDVASGNLDLYWVLPPVALTVIDRVKILALAGPAGSVPGFDAGVPNASDPRIGSQYIHYGVFASTGMDPVLRQTLHQRFNDIVTSAWAKEMFKARGVIASGGKQEDFAKIMDRDWQNWQKLMPKYAEVKQ